LWLDLDGWAERAGWHWLFLIEAAPAVILSVVTFYYLTDRPRDARWLADDERTWLSTRLAAEDEQRRKAAHIATASDVDLRP
jgi:sugar phosphate permease